MHAPGFDMPAFSAFGQMGTTAQRGIRLCYAWESGFSDVVQPSSSPTTTKNAAIGLVSIYPQWIRRRVFRPWLPKHKSSRALSTGPTSDVAKC